MSGHTPGPWFAGETNDVFAECQEDGDDPIASIHDRDNTTEAILESAANAKLIAAAPDLAEALQALLHMLNEGTDDGMFQSVESQMALDALAKAGV
jgi:hypothetical protein